MDGCFDRERDNVNWQASYNTGRVIAEVHADILICVEVENRPTLQRFNEQVLEAKFQRAYPHVMVIDGNDTRGIDVGILSRYPISGIRSHVDDANPNGSLTFSRDCQEYVIELGNDQRIVVIPNHFKSKRGGDCHGPSEAVGAGNCCGRHRSACLGDFAIRGSRRRPQRRA